MTVRSMFGKLRSHARFANVISLMALFVALGGGAYALTIPKNSVGAKQIKKNAVTGSEIKKGAVASADVKDASLRSKDFEPGQLPAGPQGPAGPTLGTFGAADDNANVPPPVPGNYLQEASTQITMPTSGRLYVFGFTERGFTCDGSGPCGVRLGLYVDGQPITNTGGRVSAAANQAAKGEITTFGITDTLAAGPHTIELSATANGVPLGSGSGQSKVGAIMLGG